MELRECPFCGSLDKISHKNDCYLLLLIRSCRGLVEVSIDELDEAWNRRASPASVPEAMKHEPMRPDESSHEMVDRYNYVNGWNACRDAMLAAAPTLPVSEDRWLSIETAPKDGTFIIVCSEIGTVWCDVRWVVRKRAGGRWEHLSLGALRFTPTHWMPLPKAHAMQEDKP